MNQVINLKKTLSYLIVLLSLLLVIGCAPDEDDDDDKSNIDIAIENAASGRDWNANVINPLKESLMKAVEAEPTVSQSGLNSLANALGKVIAKEVEDEDATDKEKSDFNATAVASVAKIDSVVLAQMNERTDSKLDMALHYSVNSIYEVAEDAEELSASALMETAKGVIATAIKLEAIDGDKLDMAASVVYNKLKELLEANATPDEESIGSAVSSVYEDPTSRPGISSNLTTANVSVENSMIWENGTTSSTSVTVTLNNPASEDVVVMLSVDKYSNASTDDYSLNATTATISTGATTASFLLSASGDSDVEESETVILTVSESSSTVVSGAGATVTIKDDDAVVSFASESSDGSSPIVVSLSNTVPQDIMVTLDAANSSTASTANYSVTSAVTISAGSTTNSFSITENNDSLANGETIILNLINPTHGSVGTTSTHTVTIAK